MTFPSGDVRNRYTFPTEYGARCMDCRFSGNWKASRTNRDRAATQHFRRNPDHRVSLLETRRTDVLSQKGQATLDDVPPF